MGLEYDQEYRIQPEHRLSDSRATYIADAAFPDSKLDIEIDGWWHYKHERTRERDLVRDQTLRENGWQVLRISGRHAYDHREEVKALIVQHLAAPLMLNKRTWLDVTSVKPTEHFEPVYSFECIPNHNYVGDSIILHNCSYCFTPDTSVFTTRGVKTLAELYQEGTNETGNGLSSKRNISGVSALTHRGRFRRVKKVFRHFYEGPVLTIKPSYLPALRCTPDHGILATTDPERPPRKVQARFITTKNYLLLPKMRAHKHVSRLDLSAFLKGVDLPKYKGIRSTRQWHLTRSTLTRIVEMSRNGSSSLEIGEVLKLHPGIVERARARLSRSSPTGLSTPYNRYRVSVSKGTVRLSNSKHTLPRFIGLDEDFAKLLGYYCADGSTSKQINRPNSFTVCFTFGKDETSNVGDVRELVKRVFGLECSVTRQGSVVHVYLSNSILGHIFKTLCGNDTYSKKVPEFVLSSSHRGIVKAFLTGYLNGDGYETAANGSEDESFLGANSVSKSLSLGVALLFLKLGSVPRFYLGENSPSTVIEGRTVSRHTDYLVKVLKRNSSSSSETLEWEDIRGLVVEREDCYLIPVKSVTGESYSGFVYNMEVEEDHTYLANFFAVSNCQNFDISQRRKVEGTDLMPPDVVSLALSHGCQGLAYTYNQPTIFMEFARDIGVEARKNGLINIFVSNGFDTPDTVALMDDFLDCITVDFKGSAETSFVRKYIGIPDAQPIFQTIQEIRDRGKTHIEITDLIVPEIGDNLDE
ncbi:DUF559 domain-containing protein, partial [Candidatus Bathyarchaeota archaeon]